MEQILVANGVGDVFDVRERIDHVTFLRANHKSVEVSVNELRTETPKLGHQLKIQNHTINKMAAGNFRKGGEGRKHYN